MQEFYIPSDGIRLHAKLEFPEGYQEGGKCPLLIVIHGLTGHMEETHIIGVANTALEKGYAALRVEMYGHGKSEGPFREHTLYKWINGAFSVVEWAKAQPFVSGLYLAGHSQGGLLTIIVGGLRCDDFKSLLPLAPAWMIPEGARAGMLLGAPFDPKHVPDTVSNGNLELNGNYIRVAQSIHVEDFFDKYTGPVLIVQGDADEAVPLSYAQKAAELYENAELVIIPGDDHCYTKHLDQVTQAVGDFLERVKAD